MDQFVGEPADHRAVGHPGRDTGRTPPAGATGNGASGGNGNGSAAPAAPTPPAAPRTTPAAPTAPAEDDRPAIRTFDLPEPEPVDLLDAAGTPVLKRALPAVVAAVVLLLLLRLILRRRQG